MAIACISSTLVAHALGGRPIYTELLERQLRADAARDRVEPEGQAPG